MVSEFAAGGSREKDFAENSKRTSETGVIVERRASVIYGVFTNNRIGARC